jgi:Aegerolysin
MAARSVSIKLRNLTDLALKRKDLHLDHGEWSDSEKDVPPEQIPAGKTVTWQSESDGVATGTEGWVLYGTDAGDVRVYWDDPYIGHNSFKVDVPPGYTETHSDISGNNAAIKVTLEPPE